MLNWAILGCGVVANEMAQAMRQSGRVPYSVGNRTHENALKFAEKYGIQKIYDTPEEMFTDKNVDVIYITTPHNTHLPFLLKALSNGKHVLCEKAITLNSRELELALKTAEAHHVILAEAMTIYHMPLYKKLYQKIVQEKQLGNVNLLQLNFGSYKEYDMNNRFFNRNLAGGALLDIGVYAISLARLFMDSCPDKICSQVKFAPTGVDESAGILMKNKEEQMAVLSLSLHSKQPKRVTISCDRAYIEIFEYPRGEKARITYTDSGKTEYAEAGKQTDALRYEYVDMEEAIEQNKACTYIAYTKDVMEIMTKIRRDWKLKYPEEACFSENCGKTSFLNDKN